jgi:uncharacterized membrane protein YeaQ/YmgE (transglycosylase-associated protein family)
MDTERLLEETLFLIKPIIIGTFGGVASVFVSGKKPDAGAIMYCICVSGFAGWIAGKLSRAFDLSPDYTDVVVGVAGFLGAVFLTMLARFVTKKLGFEIDVKLSAVERRARSEKDTSEE